jgi:hypothetical protein
LHLLEGLVSNLVRIGVLLLLPKQQHEQQQPQ